MAKKIYFYHCRNCDTIVELVENGGHSLRCCDKPMELEEVKEYGNLSEYHLPQLRHQDGLLYVSVGAKMHPQSEDHHISFIVLVSKQTVKRINIKGDGPATAIFADMDHGDVYAYCNKHGIWKTSF
jgi:superoxide reductase